MPISPKGYSSWEPWTVGQPVVAQEGFWKWRPCIKGQAAALCPPMYSLSKARLLGSMWDACQDNTRFSIKFVTLSDFVEYIEGIQRVEYTGEVFLASHRIVWPLEVIKFQFKVTEGEQLWLYWRHANRNNKTMVTSVRCHMEQFDLQRLCMQVFSKIFEVQPEWHWTFMTFGGQILWCEAEQTSSFRILIYCPQNLKDSWICCRICCLDRHTYWYSSATRQLQKKIGSSRWDAGDEANLLTIASHVL